jgi:hypothetical protein
VKRLARAGLGALIGRRAPKTGDQITVDGELVERPKEWMGPPLVLRTGGLPGGYLYLVGDLGGFEPGERVRVAGTYFEYSIYVQSGIQVEKITRR